MGGSEAKGWRAGIDIEPVVVGFRDSQMASVFCSVVVGVADQISFEVIVKIRVADSHIVGSMRDVEQSIVVIFVMI